MDGGGRKGKGKFRNLIKRNQLQQQTDSDKAKPFVWLRNMTHGGEEAGENATRLNSTSRVLYKNVCMCACVKGVREQREGSTTNYKLHLAYKTINTFTMHQTNFINNILDRPPIGA